MNKKVESNSLFLPVVYYLLFLLAVYFFTPLKVSATEVLFGSEKIEIKPNSRIGVSVFLNTENENINAVEGKIYFPENLISVQEIHESNSIVSFWLDRPIVKNGEINFSGIIPGGYVGERGLLFSVIFESPQEGEGIFYFNNLKVLLNDGKGTETKVVSKNLLVAASNFATSTFQTIPYIRDNNRPEVFNPIITADQDLFDGQYFIVFAAQDKQSGIDHYEVQEGEGQFVVADSPYLLQDQTLSKKIFVKAVDKSGNERVMLVQPKKDKQTYQIYLFFGIIGVVAISLFLVGVKKLWRKK